VTFSHKWHISGHIVDAHPVIPHIPADVYFKECAEKRLL
jgi:hypothetical protein